MNRHLWFLGTGASVATVERDNTALLISAGDRLILVDGSGSLMRKIKLLNLSPERIAAVLVTHIHPDHVFGLPALIHGLMNHDLRIRFYGSGEALDFCRNMLELFGLMREKIRCRVEFAPMEDGRSRDILSGLRVRALAVPHTTSSLAYWFEFGDKERALVYSGDTPPHSPLFELAAGIDTLIHDCSHSSRTAVESPQTPPLHTDALTLGRMAEAAGVRRLVPVHFSGDPGFSEREIEAEIRRHFSGELIIPRDLMRLSLA